MKSYDCHVIMQHLLLLSIQPFLKKSIVPTIAELCTFFKQFCAGTLNVSDLQKTQEDNKEILRKLEMIFPLAFFDIMIHLFLHLPEEAILGGLVYMRWMYPIERFLKKLKEYVRNRARPEGSIAEGYVVDEALTFCSMYFEGVETKFNRPDRNADNTTSTQPQLLVFQFQGRPYGKKNSIFMEPDVRQAAEWYILNNCSEIQPYLE